MPQLDPATFTPQIVWLAITFAVLLLVMWRVVVPRIAEVLQTRQGRLDDNLERAAALKDEAEAILAAYENTLQEARTEAQAVIAEASATILGTHERRHAELGARLTKRVAEGEAAVAKARDEALAGIREVAAEVAVAATERLIGKRPEQAAAMKAVAGLTEGRG